MKIYFTGSARASEIDKENHKLIHQLIEKLGHSHLDDYKINTDPKDFYTSPDEHKRKVYTDALNFITKADLVILEVSTNSLTMGYLIKHAIDSHTPVIALHTKHHSPGFILGISEDIFQLVEYRKDNLEKRLNSAIEYLKGTEDIRFNMMLPSTLSNYINKRARIKHTSKAGYIRDLIIKDKNDNS